jgi:CSLREA domain-containing protein
MRLHPRPQRACHAAVFLAFLASPCARAADLTFTVNTTADGADASPGDGACETATGNHVCTVRAALTEANATTGATTTEVVIPANANPYVLTVVLGYDTSLYISRSTTITGGGAKDTILDGNGTGRVIQIDHIAETDVTISGLTLRNGATAGPGGGIWNSARLDVHACVITGNTASAGGGIFSFEDSLSGHSSTLHVYESTVSGNHATSGAGGGVWFAFDAGGDITLAMWLVNTTVSGNTAATLGAGVYDSGYAQIFNSTITNNLAYSNGADSGAGAGLYTAYPNTTYLSGTILAGNLETASHKPNPPLLVDNDCTGTIGGDGANILGTTNTCTLNPPDSVVVADPLLGPLQLNGGQVPTHALQPGSPAIDAGSPADCTLFNSYDGRGAHRPEGAACDIGAYEYAANGDVNGDGVRDVADVFTLINFLFANGPALAGLGDVNGDGKTDIADVFSLINFLFASGPSPL